MPAFQISVLTGLLTKSRHVVHSAGIVATHFTHGMTTPSWSARTIVKDKTSKDRSQYPPSTTLGLVCVASHRLLGIIMTLSR